MSLILNYADGQFLAETYQTAVPAPFWPVPAAVLPVAVAERRSRQRRRTSRCREGPRETEGMSKDGG